MAVSQRWERQELLLRRSRPPSSSGPPALCEAGESFIRRVLDSSTRSVPRKGGSNRIIVDLEGQPTVKLHLDQAALDGGGDCAGAAWGVEFSQNRFNVVFYGVLAEVQAVPDLFIAFAFGHVLKHLKLARR